MTQKRAGRPSFSSRVVEQLEAAIDKLGDVRAKGAQLRQLEDVYARLLSARDIAESVDQAA